MHRVHQAAWPHGVLLPPTAQAYYLLLPTAVKARCQRRLTRLASIHHRPSLSPSWLARQWAHLPSRGGRGVAPWQGLDVPASPTAAAGGLQHGTADVDVVPDDREEASPEHAQPGLPTRDDSAHGGCQDEPTLQQLAEHVQQASGEVGSGGEDEGGDGTQPAQSQRRVTRAVAIEHQRRQLEKLAAMRRQEQEQQQEQAQQEQQQEESHHEEAHEPQQAEQRRVAARPGLSRPKAERWPQRLQRWLMHGFIKPVFG